MTFSSLAIKRLAAHIFLLGSMAFAGALHAQTVVVDGGSGGTYILSVSGLSQVAPSFRTGTAATTISEIALGFDAGPANVTLALHAADGAGMPTGASLASQQVSVVAGVNTYGAVLLGPLATSTLAPNQNYALVVRDGTAAISVNDNNSGSNNAVFSNGFSRVGSGYSSSGNSGATWIVRNYTPTFRLTVVPAVAPAATPAAIPTLSEWGIIGLSVALFGAAAMRSRRRS